jgi:hypothetical protein
MSSGTIFGQPQGKWIVGSIAPQGAETALSGKWIGEYPMVNYPALSVKVPERQVLGESLLGIGIVLAALYYVIKK